jgi:hypothetical protein
VSDVVAVKVELGDCQVAGCFGRAVAALGDEKTAVDVVKGESLLDCVIAEGFVAVEVVGGSGEIEAFG